MVSQLSHLPHIPGDPAESEVFEDLPDSFFDDDKREDEPREERVDPQTGFLE